MDRKKTKLSQSSKLVAGLKATERERNLRRALFPIVGAKGKR